MIRLRLLELTLQSTLAQPEQELLRGRLVDLLEPCERVQLVEDLADVGVVRWPAGQVRAHRAVQLFVEVLRREAGEELLQPLVRRDAGERAPLQPLSGL